MSMIYFFKIPLSLISLDFQKSFQRLLILLRKFMIIFFFIFCIFAFSSCSTSKLTADTSVALNVDNPLMLDFVFVFNQDTLKDLQKVSSIKWFTNRNQYKFDLELNNKIQILSYELVPGQRLVFKDFKPKQTPESLLIYVSYLSKGDHRIALKNFSNIILTLGKDDFGVKLK